MTDPNPIDDLEANPGAVWIDPAYLGTCAAVIADIIKAVDPIRYALLKSLADDTIDADDLRRLWAPTGPTSAEAFTAAMQPIHAAIGAKFDLARPAIEAAMRAAYVDTICDCGDPTCTDHIERTIVDETHYTSTDQLADVFARTDPRKVLFITTADLPEVGQ